MLGVSAVHFLDYVDSGMMGTPTNDAAESFWQADPEEASRRLAAILTEETADVLTVYDSNGGYGHPDHINVHRVGVRAAELAGTPLVYEATINRDEMQRMMAEARRSGLNLGLDDDGGPGEDAELGVPADQITTAVDVSSVIDRKRASMRAHGSQISEQSFFLAMPEDVFGRAFGTEWFTRRGVALPVAQVETALEGLS